MPSRCPQPKPSASRQAPPRYWPHYRPTGTSPTLPSDDSHLYLGAMTGTSVDGLDLALIEVVGSAVNLIAQRTFPLPSALRKTLLELGQGIGDNLDALGEADAALGRFIGETARGFIESQGLATGAVRAIGSHGQTVRHRPNGRNAFTLQIGDPNRIAELTGVATVADFRRRDLAAGGQGAPLAPGFHAALFSHARERRTVLNIGGISNITRLSTPLLGFDTGPGNALMDPWCAKHQGAPFDEDGAWAATGRVDEALLESLLSDPYLDQAPPKSTGREHYNLDWLSERLRARPSAPGCAADPAGVHRCLGRLRRGPLGTGDRADHCLRWRPVKTACSCSG